MVHNRLGLASTFSRISRRRTPTLHREDLPRSQIREVTRIRGVVAGVLGVREIVQPGVQREVVKVRKKAGAGVEPVGTGKVIKVCAPMPVVGIEEGFESKIVVVQDREGLNV